MENTANAWLSGILSLLFVALLVLRLRYPMASKRSEAAALAAATLLFFTVCHVFLAR